LKPTVTVLLGVYNGGVHLDQAIRSIIHQTYEDFEFLIIDDASTDGSYDLIQSWADRDKRIRLLRNNTNKGLGYTLARGVQEARGEWIARMDADDVAFPHRLEVQMRFVEESDTELDIVGSWAIDVDNDFNQKGVRRVPTTHNRITDLLWTNPFIHPTVLLRKTAIMAAGSYRPDVVRRQDYELWFRCAAAGLRFANIPETLLYYRFDNQWFAKNNARVIANQVYMGWKGCRLVNAPINAYVGVAVPLVKCMIPRGLGMAVHSVLRRFDPRTRDPQWDT